METPFEEEIVSWSRNMTRPRPTAHAYKQAPWRMQTQRGALLLIVAILGASVLWVMVSVSVQAASAGLEIQQMEDDQENMQREIAGLRTQIGSLTAAGQMEARAIAMGFEPIDLGDITYVVIPGYKGREPIIQAPPPGGSIEQPLVKPAYTQSLWEWLLQGVLEVSEPPGGVLP